LDYPSICKKASDVLTFFMQALKTHYSKQLSGGKKSIYWLALMFYSLIVSGVKALASVVSFRKLRNLYSTLTFLEI
jgi:hypothetical protein